MRKEWIRIFAMIVCLTMAMVFAGCTSEQEPQPSATPVPAKTNIRIVGLKGPTGLGMSKLMADNEAGTAANQYTFTLSSATDEVAAMVAKGEVDIAAVPTNLAANLYQKTNGKWQLAALNTLGVLYILENGNTIQDIQDLKGTTTTPVLCSVSSTALTPVKL